MRPRIRTIKPEFFEDEKINSIPVGARYVAIGLTSMADDRGRIRCMLPALRTYVFPAGDVSERQFTKALDAVLAIGFALRYEVDGWSYLWLPKFWRHQRINRPSESDLPPHPDDPHGGLPISEALAQFNESRSAHGLISESSVSAHGSLITSRAGARSGSVPTPEVELSERLAARVRANDPKAEPKPRSARWLGDMRLLLSDRGGDVAEVERIIDWCQADPFWRSNILSPGKLRKQFTQLVLRSEQSSGATVTRLRPNASDMLRALDEGAA